MMRKSKLDIKSEMAAEKRLLPVGKPIFKYAGNLIISLILAAVALISVTSFKTSAGSALIFFFVSVCAYLFMAGIKTETSEFYQQTDFIIGNKLIFTGKVLIMILLALLGVYFIRLGKTAEGITAITFSVIQAMLLFRVNAVKAAGAGELNEANKEGVIVNILNLLIITVSFYLSLRYFNKYNYALAFFFFVFGSFYSGIVLNNRSFAGIKWNVRVDYLILAVLAVLSYLIRSHMIMDIPPGVSYDEWLARPVAETILAGKNVPLFLSDIPYLVGTMYYFWLAVWGKMTGGLTFENMRMFSVFAGTLNVVMIYFLVREMFGRRTALVSAVVMTFFYYHVIYSRLSWLWVFVPLLATFSFWFYFKAENTGKIVYYALSGLFVGLGLYFYNASKMVPIILVLYWLYLLLFKSYREWLKLNIWSMFILIAAALAVFGPMIGYITEHSFEYFMRIKGEAAAKTGTNIFSVQFLKFLAENSVNNFQLFLTKSGVGGYFNLPLVPLLDRISAFFFLAGMGISLFNFKKRHYAFLLILFICSLAAAIFAVSPWDPNSQRAILSIVPLIIFISIGVTKLWEFAVNLNKRIMIIILPVIFAVFISFTAYTYYDMYFVQYPANDSVKSDFFSYAAKTVRYADRMNDKGNKVFVSHFFTLQTCFSTKKEIFYIDPGIPEYDKLFNIKKNSVIIMESLYDKQAGYYAGLFDNTRVIRDYELYSRNAGRNSDIFGPRLYHTGIEIPADSMNTTYGLSAKYDTNGEQYRIKLSNTAIPLVPEAKSIEINGLIYAPQYGLYEFKMNNSNNYTLIIDNQLVRGKLNLYKGLHSIKLRISDPGSMQELMWKNPQSSDYSIISQEYLLNKTIINGLLAEYTTVGPETYTQLEISPTHRYYFYSPRIPLNSKRMGYDVKWTGYFNAEKNGKYSFKLDSTKDSSVYIDGVKMYSQIGSAKYEKSSVLSKGWHKIEIKYNFDCNSIVYGRESVLRLLYLSDANEYAVVPYNLLKPY
ncbi:MAG: hypothetical protein CVV21_01640 [Candidatus Goldiibacteriota bacterium HGW-Goldbacteria-1]|jgi:4-amino-4-deoxy-L-arabinose transferase-like glycosyltransferase|nr:MAG: hypothetical protein CVV21_01640 [Candidatus Goldiibacteriota bacterium HGW-Goldbacteria-1]